MRCTVVFLYLGFNLLNISETAAVDVLSLWVFSFFSVKDPFILQLS